MLTASNARINKKLFSSLFTFKQRFFASTVRTQQSLVVDLTSDTATQPTDDMFDIMKLASRSDDVFAEDKSTNQLESYVAKLLGHEAALFCVSGSMTNQLGLRVLLTQPPHSVLCDARSHIYNYECGGIAYHSQASALPVLPSNRHHLTVKDIANNLMTDPICSPLTKVVSLENTLNGTIMPLDEIERVRQFCKRNELKMHLDGARLWNASQATGIPLKEYGRHFDTVSICLSKGVGAPIGSILVGSAEHIGRARHIRKLMGGGWRQSGSLAAAAHHCIQTVVPTMSTTHRLTRQLAYALQSMGIQLTLPCETNMIFIDTSQVGFTIDTLAKELAKENILIASDSGHQTRLVLHYQIPKTSIDTFIQITSKLVEQHQYLNFNRNDISTTVDSKVAYPSKK
ncbi:hypothetical protein G6F46_010410 [Rhizopus delemar]|uniref:Aromatic amino acid beta-eliminating lyase/threonine aldolase domain-containing protein n=3 Tax=Rhizopus TaxID=4842 RepID=I1C9C0_RHIO9|nr:hypothetical protein RO3G_09760 [Rhizopus delemar RA 99-880]KAG1450544.1 hypothetical protein G6F55_009636 [Rhizopus delemar]KAG1543407.1 hypothetical protein G6F51_006694 [Rhizopus arrhizus]KAG1496364.1 hypothetical protein G6F54_006522 [Rhizopus delemar]KAG1505519.1 hypothetical protein G6F53_010168 [Rhizopus delemar]|eukprot:EIE85050.1 hypothetical protein RO3G_09760 [Rhizopus delemar RA 99-880]